MLLANHEETGRNRMNSEQKPTEKMVEFEREGMQVARNVSKGV
jgi:hypothetical protein